MWDVRIAELAGRQFNRVSREQLRQLGLSERAIDYRIAAGRLVVAEEGVYAVSPLLGDDDWGRWMGATLTAPGSVLSMVSAAAAQGFWTLPRRFETVTRPGSGGPRWHGGVRVHRSTTLDGECEVLHGIPITTAPRTLLDLSRGCGDRALARAVREAIRLERTSLAQIGEVLGRHRGRRGTRRLALVLSRYSGLPLERARSGAEIRALEVLRGAHRPLPRLNVRIAGEEADLSWSRERLIIEVDGAPYHLDVGEDARKEAAWRAAGWTVKRLPSDDVYTHPARLLALAPSTNVPETTP
jgi:hypothetical protein